MELKSYLADKKIPASAFAAQIGVSHTTVSRWLSLLTFPSPEVLQKIHDATDGEVTANDFMAARSRPAAPAQAAE